MKQFLYTLPLMVLAQTAAAEITVPTYECQGGAATQVADSTLDAYNDELMLSEYGRPTDDHVILVTQLDAAVWMTLPEVETFCVTPEYVTAMQCGPDGGLYPSQIVAGDIVKMAELGIDRVAPAEGQRISIDPTGSGRWTSETDAQLDEICVAQEIIALTKYFCNAEGEIQTFVQNGTKGQLEAWNYAPDMPDNATGLYYDTQGLITWSILSPLEMAVLCESTGAPEALDGQWDITVADFDGGSCPAEVMAQAQAQMATGTVTRDITWPSPWSPAPLLDDSNAMGGSWRKGADSWHVTLVEIQQSGANVRVSSTLDVISPERIAYMLLVDIASMNCRAEINATAQWVSE
jgi:hypothetical protein